MAAAALVVVCSGGPATAEERLELTLADCIDRALKNNLGFRSSYLGLKTANLSIIQAQAGFDPSVSFNVSRDESTRPTFYQYYGVKRIDSEYTQMSLRLNKSLEYGTRVGFGFSNYLSVSNIETEKNFTSSLGFSFEQPLWKGFGKKVNTSTIYRTRISKERTINHIELEATQLVYDVLNAYWNLDYEWETLGVRMLAIDQADSLLAYNIKGRELGVMTDSDVLEAESMLIARQQEVLEQENRIRNAEDTLRRLINMTSEEDWALRLYPVDTPTVDPVDLDAGRILAGAFQNRPEFIVARRDIEEYELNLALSENNIAPGLDLSAGYNINGSGTTYDRNLKQIGKVNQYGWSVGLLFSYPLKNRSAKADLEKKQVDIRRGRLTIEELENNITTEIRSSIRAVENAREQIDVARKAVDVNELKLRTEEARFRNRLTSSYYVLQYQADLANARNSYHRALMGYTVAISGLMKARGVLLDEYKISIIERSDS